MLGFKMSGDIRRNIQGGQDKWRIEDPRGFELEITSTNLSMLLADTTLEKGEILDKCVWARENGQNLLLTVESEEYVEAVRMTKIATSNASWTDVKIGNVIVLQNGITGRYLGRMHTLDIVRQSMESESSNMSDKMLHFVLSDKTEHSYPKTITRELHLIASPKLSSIADHSEISMVEAEVLANEAISNEDCYVSCSGYRNVFLAAANPIKLDKCRFLLVDADDTSTDIWKSSYYSTSSVYLVRMKDGILGLPHTDSNGHNTISPVREELFAQGLYSIATKPAVRSHRHYGRSNVRDTVYIKVDPADVVSIHRLRVETDTKTGNTVGNLV
jgi:hypothetical protein